MNSTRQRFIWDIPARLVAAIFAAVIVGLAFALLTSAPDWASMQTGMLAALIVSMGLE